MANLDKQTDSCFSSPLRCDQEQLSQAEVRANTSEMALRDSRRELEDKLLTKARELDAQEAHFTLELVSMRDLSKSFSLCIHDDVNHPFHLSRREKKMQSWVSKPSFGMSRLN